MNITELPEPARDESASWMLVFCAWLVAGVATLGSLFFSEVMGHAPCILCWYQRICMYPLLLILPAGLFPFDVRLVRYALPLAVAGLLLAIFHLLLSTRLIPESIRPCVQGVPCTDVQIAWLGFVTIPLLSALAFLLVIALLWQAHSRSSN